MQGRRYDDQNPGIYKGTRNPYAPVLKEGHWQEPTIGELQKHDMVHQLEVIITQIYAGLSYCVPTSIFMVNMMQK